MGLTIRMGGGPALDRGAILGTEPRNPDRLVLSTHRSGCGLVFGASLLVVAAMLELGLFARPPQRLRLAAGIAIGVAGAFFFSRRLTILDRSRNTLERGIGLITIAVSQSDPCQAGSVILRERTDEIETEDSSYDVTSFEGLLSERALIRGARWEEVRSRVEILSAFLGVPLVDEVSGLTIPPEELDIPLAERARRLGWSRTRDEPDDVRAVVDAKDDRSLHIRIPSPRGSGLLGMAALAFFGFTIPVTLLGGPILSLLPTVLLIVAWIKVRFGLGASVRVDAQQIEIENRGLIFIRITGIPVSELEDLLIRSPEDTPTGLAATLFPAVLIIRSDRAYARIGWELARAELEWLRDEILAVLTTGDASQPPGTLSPAEQIPTYPTGIRLWPAAGWLAGILAAMFLPGRGATCFALPFLEHVLSVGGLAGLASGLLVARMRGRTRRYDSLLLATIAAGLLTLLLARDVHPLVQPYPTFSESVVAGSSRVHRVVWAGWIPTATAANIALAALLAIPLARAAGRIRQRFGNWRARRQAKKTLPDPREKENWIVAVWGWVFVGCGVATPVMLLTSGSLDEGRIQSFAGGLVVGMLFLVPGLWALEAWKWIPRSWTKANVAWNELFGGSMAALVGVFIIAMAFLEPDERVLAPRGVIAAAGGAFLFAGLSILANMLPLTSRTKNITTRVVVSLLLASFAAVAIWATFDGSPIFGLGAVLLIGLLAASVRSIWKEWRTG